MSEWREFRFSRIIEFLDGRTPIGNWKKLIIPDFKLVEFYQFGNEAGLKREIKNPVFRYKPPMWNKGLR